MRALVPPAPPSPSETGRMIRALTSPPPPAPAPSDTGRMRAMAPPMKPIPAMQSAPAAPPTIDFPAWTPENGAPRQDDEFAQISAQARLGVQQKVVDEASRRKTQRLLMACGAAVVVAGGIVFLIEKFYDPEARAREAAIAATVQQMTDQQKVTDNLTLIEIDIENAIMSNDLEIARRELAKLVEKSPNHPRREFLQASIDRAAALARLSPQTAPSGEPPALAPTQAAVVSSPSNPSRPVQKPRAEERTPERVASRQTEIAPKPRSTRDIPQTGPRTFGSPIGESAGQPTIPLNAPINSAPVSTVRRSDNSFVGRTLEAGDNSPLTRAPQTAPANASAAASSSANNPALSGSAAVAVPPAAAPQPSVALDVVPARVVKRVAPTAPLGISRKTAGFVVVKFNISETGKVSDVEVVESNPSGVFDDAAQSAVRKWMYEPRKENGSAVASQAKARLVFDAEN
jgi:TonB family protein